jgi:hypothetical protein
VRVWVCVVVVDDMVFGRLYFVKAELRGRWMLLVFTGVQIQAALGKRCRHLTADAQNGDGVWGSSTGMWRLACRHPPPPSPHA